VILANVAAVHFAFPFSRHLDKVPFASDLYKTGDCFWSSCTVAVGLHPVLRMVLSMGFHKNGLNQFTVTAFF
jgi:hypothetical protein